MIVILDNYDSFTYNLYQYIGEMNQEVCVIRNDQITVAALKAMAPSLLVISPGPGYPKDAGISLEAVRAMGKDIPVLGICLGHQAIGEAFGAKVVLAKEMVHGKVTPIEHNGKGLFENIPSPLQVTRYHSLVVAPKGLPEELEITAQSADNEIMGLKHRHYPIYGLQFHPESIATDGGKIMLRNFLKLSVRPN